MAVARILPAIEWLMDHRVLGLRDPATGEVEFYLSWYTFAFTSLGAVGNLAFLRRGNGPDASYRVLTDSTHLYEAVSGSTGPKADRARYLAEPPVTAQFSAGSMIDPHNCSIASSLGRIEASWSALASPIFAVGSSPARPDSHETYSVLIEAASGSVTVDGARVAGSPYRNEIWTDWLGRPMSSALVALGEVVVRKGTVSTTLPVRDLDADAYRPFGRVIEADGFGALPFTMEGWRGGAEGILGAPVETRMPHLVPPAERAVSKIEVHHSSPQLAAAMESDWCVVVFPVGWTPDGGQPGRPSAYRVPRGAIVSIDAGVWHAGVMTEKETDVLVAFKEGTLANGSAVATLDVPVEIDWP